MRPKCLLHSHTGTHANRRTYAWEEGGEERGWIGGIIPKALCGNVIFLVGNTYSYAVVLLVTPLEPTYLTIGAVIPLQELYWHLYISCF